MRTLRSHLEGKLSEVRVLATCEFVSVTQYYNCRSKNFYALNTPYDVMSSCLSYLTAFDLL